MMAQRRILMMIALGCLVGTAAAQEFPGTLTGPVSKVRDADTIEVIGVAVRLRGVAAPEREEPGGEAAADFVEKLMLGRSVVCRLTGERNEDRAIGVCFLDGTDVGKLVIRVGHGRDCPRFSGGRYAGAEKAAREGGRDLSKVYELPSYCTTP